MRFLHRGSVYKKAYIEKGVSALKNYLTMSWVDKGRASVHNREAFNFLWGFIDQEYPELMQRFESGELEIDAYDLEDFDYAEEIVDVLPDEVLEAFGRYTVAGGVGQFETDFLLPSFVFLEFKRIVTNQWLIHFTSNARSIAKEGFRRGACDYTTLGLTTWAASDDTGHEEDFFCEDGYNFAFTLEELNKKRRLWNYGNGREAVMFKASGVECWHKGDREHQVIFLGNTARDIIPIFRDPPTHFLVQPVKVFSCVTGKVLREGEDLQTVIDWVVSHYNQYKKHLVCR